MSRYVCVLTSPETAAMCYASLQEMVDRVRMCWLACVRARARRVHQRHRIIREKEKRNSCMHESTFSSSSSPYHRFINATSRTRLSKKSGNRSNEQRFYFTLEREMDSRRTVPARNLPRHQQGGNQPCSSSDVYMRVCPLRWHKVD